jgi:hypothetical protein
MKSPRNKFFIGFALLGIAALVGSSIYAACGSTVLVGNASTGYQPSISGTPGTTLQGSFWQVGSGATANSGTLTTASMITAFGSGYYVYTDWVNLGAVGCPGVPPPAGTRNAFLYSIANGGSAQYLVMSVAVNGSGQFNYDDITNGPGNTPAPIAIPQVTGGTRAPVTGGSDYTINWTALTALKGYYDSAPTNNIITGMAVYYWNGAGAPTNYNTFDASNWVLAAGNSHTGYLNWGVAGTDPGSAVVFLPTAAPVSTYFALRPLFDGWTPGTAGFVMAPAFVGQAQIFAGPTPAGLFVQDSVSASHGQVTVNWRTNVESAVAGFDVLYSRTKAGPFTLVAGTDTAPKGNNSAYSVTFPKPVRVERLFFKVEAHMTDGSSQFSDIMKLGDDDHSAGLGKVLPD